MTTDPAVTTNDSGAVVAAYDTGAPAAPAPAVTAATEAVIRIVHRDLHPDGQPCRLCDVAAPEMARAAVAAARPIIEAEVKRSILAELQTTGRGVSLLADAFAKHEAEVRERIAAEIEEVGCGDVCGCSITITDAARIARGQS